MIRVVRMSFMPEFEEAFLLFFNERKERIRHFPGCTHLALWKDKNAEAVFYTYSLWSHPDDLTNYRNSDLFQETWAQVKLWFNEKPHAFSADQILSL
ncbi:MAG TPA: antibiotic biosynthesis monooxygenase [Chitinophagaceae bacterium]|nr:antibiotic biosynthesis monooxygenase [Chitinophagaceae bacterium]